MESNNGVVGVLSKSLGSLFFTETADAATILGTPMVYLLFWVISGSTITIL